MHIQREHRVSRILELPYRNELKQLLTGKLDLGPFSEYFADPSYFYAQGYPDSPGNWDTFRDQTLLPLWQHGELIYAVDVDKPTLPITRWYIECPDESDAVPSVDNALFDMIELHVWEFGGDRQEVRESLEFAQLVALPRLPELKTLLGVYDSCTADMISEFRASLDIAA